MNENAGGENTVLFKNSNHKGKRRGMTRIEGSLERSKKEPKSYQP